MRCRFGAARLSTVVLTLVLLAATPVASAGTIYIGALLYSPSSGFAIANYSGPGQNGVFETHTWMQIVDTQITATGNIHDPTTLIVVTGRFLPTTNVTYFDLDYSTDRTVDIYPTFRTEVYGYPTIGSLSNGFVAGITADPVPEPATWTLGGLALGGLLMVRYKRARPGMGRTQN